MTGSDHVETKRPGWLLIRDRGCLFPSRSLLVFLCVFVREAVDLAASVVGVGREYVCVGVSVLQEAAQFSLPYMERMDPSQDICRKLILSSIHHLGFVRDSSFTVCINGSYRMSSAYFKFPRHFPAKCIWTWDWVLWIFSALTIWLFMMEVCAAELHHQFCKQTKLTQAIAN